MKLKSITKLGMKAWSNMDPQKKEKIKREVIKQVKSRTNKKR